MNSRVRLFLFVAAFVLVAAPVYAQTGCTVSP
jgi:hypothetical protein